MRPTLLVLVAIAVCVTCKLPEGIYKSLGDANTWSAFDTATELGTNRFHHLNEEHVSREYAKDRPGKDAEDNISNLFEHDITDEVKQSAYRYGSDSNDDKYQLSTEQPGGSTTYGFKESSGKKETYKEEIAERNEKKSRMDEAIRNFKSRGVFNYMKSKNLDDAIRQSDKDIAVLLMEASEVLAVDEDVNKDTPQKRVKRSSRSGGGSRSLGGGGSRSSGGGGSRSSGGGSRSSGGGGSSSSGGGGSRSSGGGGSRSSGGGGSSSSGAGGSSSSGGGGSRSAGGSSSSSTSSRGGPGKSSASKSSSITSRVGSPGSQASSVSSAKQTQAGGAPSKTSTQTDPKKSAGAPQSPKSNAKSTLSRVLDNIQHGLDVAGLAPAVGNLADLANAGIHAIRGNKLGAATSLAAAVPAAGQAVTLGKWASKAAEASKTAVDKIADQASIVKSYPRNKKTETLKEAEQNYEQAVKAFKESVDPNTVKSPKDGLHVGQTPDGRTVTVRKGEQGTGNHGPTLEIKDHAGDITKVRVSGPGERTEKVNNG